MCGCLLHVPYCDLAHNPGMCPYWESNQWPFGSQASQCSIHWATTSTEVTIVTSFIFRERGREGERGAEKHWWERETSISCPCVPTWDLVWVTQACALTGNQTRDLLLCGRIPNQLSHIKQVPHLFLYHSLTWGNLIQLLFAFLFQSKPLHR